MNREESFKIVMGYKFKRLKVSSYQGDKKGTRCPRCGWNEFGYHVGREKSCVHCGYDNFWNRNVRSVKWLVRRSRSDEVTDDHLEDCVRYVKLLRPVDMKARPKSIYE